MSPIVGLVTVGSKAVVLMLFIHCLLLLELFLWFSSRFWFCCAIGCAISSFAIIQLGKRELVDLLLFSSECHMAFIFLFFLHTVPVCNCGIYWSYLLIIANAQFSNICKVKTSPAILLS